MVALQTGFPANDPQEIASLYHNKKDGGDCRKQVDTATKVLENLLKKEVFPRMLPVSEVAFEKEFSVTTSFDVLFLTEADLVRVTGFTSRQLKMGKAAQLNLEDGSGTVQGWHISTSGFPLEHLFSVPWFCLD